MKHIKVLQVIFFISYKIFAQSPELDQLNEAALPINSFTNANGYENLMPIITMLADKEVVGIGEATHGTKEFFQLKQKVSEVLIQELGFKVLIIETYFADTEEMNHYVLTGEGNPYHALIGMGVGFMYNQQMLDLFTWIRDYNSGKDDEEKVRIYGCDMQAPQKTAMKLIQHLQSVGISDIDLEEKLTWLSKRLPRNTLNLEEKDSLLAMVKKLRSFSTLFEVGFERKKYELHTRLIEQYVNYNTSKNSLLLREEYMAENCFSIIGLEEGKKAIVSSHNVHVAKESGFYSHATMGKYISERFRGNYYCLATSFAKGSFRAVDMNEQKKAIIHLDAPHKKSHDLLFSNCRYPKFFLDFNSLSETELRIELSKAKDFWSIGEAYFSLKRSTVKQSLTNNYDGIIFIRETSPPGQLSWDLIDRQF